MNHYKEFIEYQISIGQTLPFGWHDNVREFEVVSAQNIYDDKGNDVIRIECKYTDKDLNYDSNSDIISKSDKTFNKRLEYYKTRYDEFIVNKRDEKLKDLGI